MPAKNTKNPALELGRLGVLHGRHCTMQKPIGKSKCKHSLSLLNSTVFCPGCSSWCRKVEEGQCFQPPPPFASDSTDSPMNGVIHRNPEPTASRKPDPVRMTRRGALVPCKRVLVAVGSIVCGFRDTVCQLNVSALTDAANDKQTALPLLVLEAAQVLPLPDSCAPSGIGFATGQVLLYENGS